MSKSTPDNPTKNALEWAVFGVSSVLVLLTVGWLGWSAATTQKGPAKLEITAGKPVVENGWVKIPVTVRNRGQHVAANVQVQVCIGSGEDRREAGFTLDFVSRDAERRGTAAFKGATLPTVPECQVVGYEEP